MAHPSASLPGTQDVSASAVFTHDYGYVIQPDAQIVARCAGKSSLNKCLHDGVNTGIGLETKTQGPLRGERPQASY